MPFKINIGNLGKTWKVESQSESFVGMKIGDKIDGKEIVSGLEGYELQITGASDKAGFPAKKDVDGVALQKVLLKKGWGMHTTRPKGIRLKKTVRGNILSSDIIQINLTVSKEGGKKLEDVFPDQNKPKEKSPKPDVPSIQQPPSA